METRFLGTGCGKRGRGTLQARLACPRHRDYPGRGARLPFDIGIF